MVSVRPGGRSAYVKTEGSNRTYLRNHRLLRVDTASQVTEAITYEVTCKECSPSLVSSLQGPGRPWQLIHHHYMRPKQGEKKSVLFGPSKGKTDGEYVETKEEDSGLKYLKRD